MSRLLGAMAILLVTLAVYVPAMNAEFIWDDDVLLTKNQHMRSVRGLIDLWIAPQTLDYFPFTLSLLWVQWQFWGAANPAGYHVVCILLHALNALLLWMVLHRMRVPGAWLAGVIFAVHPVCVESVAWIAEIKNTWSLPFFLLSIYAWLVFDETQGRHRWKAFGWSLGFFTLALLAKTSVVTLPLVLLLHAWWRRGKLQRLDFLHTLPFFIIGGVLAVVTIIFQHSRAIGDSEIPIGGPLSRIAGAGMALCFYLYKALIPLNLMIVYPRWPINPPVWWTFLFGLLFLALLGLCWRRRKSSWGRAAILSLGFFTFMLAPALGFVKMSYMRDSLVADHFQYVAIIGIVGLVSAAAATFWNSTKGAVRQLLAAFILVVIGLLAIQTFHRAAVFKNQGTLWTDGLRQNPDAWAGHNILGGIEIKRGDLEKASFHLHEALRLAPEAAENHHNLSMLLSKMGRPEEAVRASESALRLAPHVPIFRRTWILARLDSGQLEWADAVKDLEECLLLAPEDGRINNDLSLAYIAAGNVDAAIKCAERAVSLAPKMPEFQNTLGLVLSAAGRIGPAIEAYRHALSLKADFTPSLIALSWILATNEAFANPAEAVKLAGQAAAQTGENDAGVLDVLAAAYAASGDFARAVEASKQAVALAKKAGDNDQEKAFSARLVLYKEGKPYRE